MHILLHIWMLGKYQLNWHPRNMIKSCLRPNNSNGKIIRFCKCERMDECGLCSPKIVLGPCVKYIKSWAILGFDSKHNISDDGCYYKFNNKKNWCVMCNWMWASFNTPTLHLQPLPIMGLGYFSVKNINKSWNNLQI